MKRWPVHLRARRCAHLCRLLSIAFVTLLCCDFAWAAPVATVQAVAGQFRVKRRSAASFAAAGVRTNLNVGDFASTGPNSKASLLFNNGSQLRLNSNSTIEITSPSPVGKGKRSLFRAVSGEVWARLRPGQAAQTRSAIAGVRGTEFILAVAPDETSTLTVVEGAVEFFNEFGDVTVGESQRSVARLGSAPTAPVTIDNAGFLLEWTLDLERAALPRETVFVSRSP
ncbi:MAG TPA: FecR family protein, partial [Abditibacteriaceae bacterium]